MVSRAGDKDKQAYQTVVDLWHDTEVRQAHAEVPEGTAVEVRRDGSEVQQILRRVQDGIRAQR
ncbi:hypothetical protein [Nocardia thraciensis]